MDLRLLTADDAEASLRMAQQAFGLPTDGRASFSLGPEVRRWGIFDGEALAAKANERSYDSLIGGRPVPTAGVAGVAVAPEYRGTGLARRVMTHLLATARDRGAVVSTLFRTAPALYRSLGYEQVAELVDGVLPTAALRGIRADRTSLRRALPADVEAIRRVYDLVAATGSCLLSRRGVAFDFSDDELLASCDGITLAIDPADGIVGYLSWNRGAGYGASAALEVIDLLALTGDAHRALLGAVSSFEAVTPMTRFRTSGDDPIQWLVPGAGWAVTEVRQYMLRVIDLVGAVAARGWPEGFAATIDLEVDDPVCPWNSGRHRLEIHDGVGRVVAEAVGSAPTVMTPNGLAVLFAGGVGVAALRRAGLLEGPPAATDFLLDAAFAGPRPAILDYF